MHTEAKTIRRTGIGKALLAAALFGLSTPLAKGLLADTSPQLIAGLLYSGSGVGLGALWIVYRRRTLAEAPLRCRDVPWLAGAIAAGGVLGPLLLLTGLARTAASSASLLLNLEGVFTAIIAWLVFRENIDRRIALGMSVIVLGGALLSWRGELAWGSVIGPLAIVGATLAWGIDNNLTQRVSASDPVRITALKGLVAGSVNTGIALWVGSTWPSGLHVLGALALGLVSYGVSIVLYVRALRDLGAARTGAYFALAPFIGAVLSLVLWHEPVTLLFLVAAALMALGLWLHLSERHEHWHVHEPMTHTHAHVHDAHHQHAHAPGTPPGEPHTHEHTHARLVHSHPHYPDIHHRHPHE